MGIVTNLSFLSRSFHPMNALSAAQLNQLAEKITDFAAELGFQQAGICDTDLSAYTPGFLQWLENNFHGEMDYMARHGSLRYRPEELLPGTLRIISLRMDYLPPSAAGMLEVLKNPDKGFISRYALGRDYHKLIRKRLQQLAQKIQQEIGEFGYRAFTDSAPILERPLAEKAGLGWTGKHSNIINRKAGSWFFLGEIFTDLPLPVNQQLPDNHCGRCTACMDICPTNAIVEPYTVDARRCISYLTIELKSAIPVELRPMMGNRIYGCDDCQLACPWNRFSKPTVEDDFKARHQLDAPDLLALFGWDEDEFLQRMEGSPIRRIGHEQWLRNIAVALGNALAQANTEQKAHIITALRQRRESASAMVKEHIDWALNQKP